MEGMRMAEISFFAAECMEFPESLGELHENLTLSEAVDVYIWICRKNRPYGPGIGFVLQDENIPDYSGIRWPLYQGRGIAKEMIGLIPAYQEYPLVKQAVEDMETYLEKLEGKNKEERGMEYPEKKGR
jgi:hypothetical protein